MIEFEYLADESYIKFKVHCLIYPMNVIMKAAYSFTTSFYILMDYIDERYIEVQFRAKNSSSRIELENKAGDFYNELLQQKLRYDIQSRTKDLRQLILGRALYTECIDTKSTNDGLTISNDSEIEIQKNTLKEEYLNSSEDYESDIYNIAKCWEQGMEHIENDEK